MISSLDLARLCGVSQGTVDRALHDRAGVSPTTKAKILEMAEKYGYRPNPAVATLLTGESQAVGAIVPAGRSVFFMDAVTSLQRALSKHGLRLYICPSDGDQDFIAVLEDFAARRMRAAVVVPPREGLVLPQSLDMRVISLLSPLKGRDTRFVAIDELSTGARAVEYLWKLGHRRITHVTFARKAHAIERRTSGFAAALKGRGVSGHVLAEPTPEQLLAHLRRFRPTALFCHNDWLALSTLRTLSAAGIQVPDQVSVLGVDDAPSFRELFGGLTTLRYPIEALAESATQCVVSDALPGPLPEVELVERGSVKRVGLSATQPRSRASRE